MKEISQYLHLYLGCNFIHSEEKEEIKYLAGVNIENNIVFDDTADESGEGIYMMEDCKLILRPLSDMTEEELIGLVEMKFNYQGYHSFRVENETMIEPAAIYFKGINPRDEDVYCTQYISSTNPYQFLYLLKIRIDLFGIIEAGLAIDKTTLEQ